MKKIILFLSVGLLAGFINGFFGTGGAIPLLGLFAFLSMPTDKAFATTGFCVMVLSAFSFALYLKSGALTADFLPEYFDDILFPALVGGTLGSLFLSKLAPNLLKKIFFAITVVGGLGAVLK